MKRYLVRIQGQERTLALIVESNDATGVLRESLKRLFGYVLSIDEINGEIRL